MKQNPECKTCTSFCNAGRKIDGKKNKHMAKYNAWCCKFSKPAKEALGECKLKNGWERNIFLEVGFTHKGV